MMRALGHPAAAAIAAASIALLAAAQPAEAQDVCQPHVKSDPASLLSLMRSWGMDARPEDAADGKDRILWNMSSTVATLSFRDEGGTIRFFHGTSGAKVSIDAINDWNKNFRFSRAYLDQENDPIVEMDLDLAGGVCEDRIRDFLRTAVATMRTWNIEVLHKYPQNN
jgi:hypothetical protein